MEGRFGVDAWKRSYRDYREHYFDRSTHCARGFGVTPKVGWVWVVMVSHSGTYTETADAWRVSARICKE